MNKLVLLSFLLLLACGAGGCGSEESSEDSNSKGEERGQAQMSTDSLMLTGQLSEDRSSWQMKLENTTEEDLTLQFKSGQEIDVTITEEESGEKVYRYSDGQMFTQALKEVTIEAGSSKTWEEKLPDPLESGAYRVHFEVTAESVNGESPQKPLSADQTFSVE
ncbi:BsuPI-related putative proteinase inhibitor [Alteribacillus sp. HJP-4]|uniref:BsuPI-related putative proteinase inhibitor n=1 Tax=Alteribacillus sp. HJP-4 TaxID=2775394 RepID=UPI0035CCDCFB